MVLTTNIEGGVPNYYVHMCTCIVLLQSHIIADPWQWRSQGMAEPMALATPT